MRISATVLRDVDAMPRPEEVDLAEPQPHEVRVRLASSGICATDVHAAGLVYAGMLSLPVVLGHEGAGVVEAVGDQVGRVAVGDHVAMVFDSCGTCHHCVRHAPSYCSTFDARNFGGGRLDGTTSLSAGDEAIGSHFLGQSAFATHSVVSERSVVKIDPSIPLDVVGPFGCGIMTGAGAVLNELRPTVDSTIAVFGAGTVGLAGVMAARAAGCAEIVAVDLSPARLALAQELGATHVVDAGADDVAEAVRAVVPGGVELALDTTGLTSVVSTAVAATAARGRTGVVGVGADQTMELDWRLMLAGRSVMGITSGSADPDVFLPQLLELHRAGRFPVDRLVTTYSFAQFDQALADSRSGAVVKAVLTY